MGKRFLLITLFSTVAFTSLWAGITITGGGGGGSSSVAGINDLTDVDTAGASAGQPLEYDGAVWVPGTDNIGAGGGSSLEIYKPSVFSSSPNASVELGIGLKGGQLTGGATVLIQVDFETSTGMADAKNWGIAKTSTSLRLNALETMFSGNIKSTNSSEMNVAISTTGRDLRSSSQTINVAISTTGYELRTSSNAFAAKLATTTLGGLWVGGTQITTVTAGANVTLTASAGSLSIAAAAGGSGGSAGDSITSSTLAVVRGNTDGTDQNGISLEVKNITAAYVNGRGVLVSNYGIEAPSITINSPYPPLDFTTHTVRQIVTNNSTFSITGSSLGGTGYTLLVDSVAAYNGFFSTSPSSLMSIFATSFILIGDGNTDSWSDSLSNVVMGIRRTGVADFVIHEGGNDVEMILGASTLGGKIGTTSNHQITFFQNNTGVGSINPGGRFAIPLMASSTYSGSLQVTTNNVIINSTDTVTGWVKQVFQSSMTISTPSTNGFGNPIWGQLDSTHTATVYEFRMDGRFLAVDPQISLVAESTGTHPENKVFGIAIATAVPNGTDRMNMVQKSTMMVVCSSMTAGTAGRVKESGRVYWSGAGAQASNASTIYVYIWPINQGGSGQVFLHPPVLYWKKLSN